MVKRVKTKNTKGSKKSTQKQQAVAAAPPAPEPAPVAKTVAPVPVVENTLSDGFTELLAKLQQTSQLLSSLKTDLRALEKRATREMKALQKVVNKRKRKAGARKPSGFTKPTLISDELASFLKVPPGTEMARTEVTKEINKYVVAHNLKDKNNGRKINPDKALAKLLKLGKNDELTYLNLQRYMKGHFAKASTSQ